MPKRTPANPPAIPRLAAALALALAAATPGSAQPVPDPPAEPAPAPDAAPDAAAEPAEEQTPEQLRARWFDQLNDPDHAVRQAATFALLQDEGIDNRALEQMHAAAQDPETRRRVVHIAEHHLMRRWIAVIAQTLRGDEMPPAALGFSYDALLPNFTPNSRDAGFVILNTLPGFPAHAHLLPGDIILAIDSRSSRALTANALGDWMKNAISERHRAGDTITLTVHREGETIEMALTCAGMDTMGETYSTDSVRLVNSQQYIEAMLAQFAEHFPSDAEPETLAPAR